MSDIVDLYSFEYPFYDSGNPGVIDVTDLFPERMDDEDFRKLKLAMQSNQKATVLRLPCYAVEADHLRELVEPLGNLAALQELYICGTSAFFFCC